MRARTLVLWIALASTGIGCKPGDKACVDDQEFFAESVAPIVEQECSLCHVPDGLAAETHFVWNVGETESNFDMFADVAKLNRRGTPLLLLKPTLGTSHTGGQRIVPGSAEYDVMEEWVNRVNQPGGCEDPGSTSICVDGPMPGTAPLRRLTEIQFRNTIHDLFDGHIEAGEAFPDLRTDGGFSTYDTNNLVSAVSVEEILMAAEEVSAEAAPNYDQLLPCGTSVDDDCAESWIRDFGRRTWRRPLDEDEVALLMGVWDAAEGDAEVGVGMIIEVLLQSPPFLYLDVSGSGEVDENGVELLTDHAIAARLSYALWATMPDAALDVAADAGELHTEEQIREHAERMIDDPRATEVFEQFHVEWLKLSGLASAPKSSEMYPDYDASVGQSLADEITRFTTKTWEDGGTYEDLLLSRSTLVNSHLEEIYGIDAGSSGPSDWVETDLPGDERSGLLTRAGFLAANATDRDSRPVRRGNVVLNDILCRDFAAPPGVAFDAVDIDPDAPEAEKLAAHRADKACAACHDQIDPVGLSFEHYAALGEWRDTYPDGDPVISEGEMLNPAVSVADAVELSDVLVAEPDSSACYALQWVRFSQGRLEEDADSCTLDEVSTNFAESGGDLRSLLLDIVTQPTFRTRLPADLEE